VDNRKGDAQSSGFSHLLDAIGVKIRAVKPAAILDAAFSEQHVVDDPDQLVVALIKKQPGKVIAHKMLRKHYIQKPEISRNPQTIYQS